MHLGILHELPSPACTDIILHLLLLLSYAIPCGGLYDARNRIESARLYGNIDYYAYYFVDLLVGTPPQRVSVIVDTGSGVLAFPCASCGHCGTHIDPQFDFAKSSTAEWQKCGTGCRGSCSSGHCGYAQSYTEGSSIRGFYFHDEVRFGDTIQRNPSVVARMGCHQNENNLFYTQKANGILGIGPLSNGRETLLRELFKDSEHVQASIFSLCLAEWGGRMVVGGYNTTYHQGSMQWVPLDSRSGYYHVSISELRLGDQVLARPRGGRAMIDSGTTYTYMDTTAYRALKAGIESYCQANANCGSVQQGKCWSTEDVSRFPTISVTFGSVSTAWVPNGYLFRKGSTNRWCYAFEDDGMGASTTLGASWMVHKDVIFDGVSNRVGIVPAACPEYRDRPKHDAGADLSVPPGSDESGSAQALQQKVLSWAKNPSNRAPLIGLSVVVSCWIFLCCCCICRCCCRRRGHRHVQLKEVDEPGMPPQIVGTGAGPDTFVIGDDEADEEEGFEYVHDIDLTPAGNGLRMSGLGSPRGLQNWDDEEAELTQNREEGFSVFDDSDQRSDRL